MRLRAPRVIVATSLVVLALSGRAGAEKATLSVLHTFTGSDGASPNSRLIAVGGDFWGTTASGGLWRWGSIFRISRSGEFASIYSFLGLGDGGHPQQLVLGPDGAVYGTTQAIQRAGQPDIWGTFFRISPSGGLTTLFVFRALQYGYRPGPLMLAHDGNFYGWTATGGANGYGTAFRVTTDGTLTVLHDFAQFDEPDGAFVEASDGSLYVAGGGQILWMTLNGEVSFADLPGGSPVLGGRDGRLRTTAGNGTFCERSGPLSFLPGGQDVRFAEQVIPMYLELSLQARDGSIFGIGGTGCLDDYSQIYRFTSSGTLTFQAKFPVFEHSNRASLTEDTDGQLYGTTSAEGPSGAGTVFRLTPGSSAATAGDADGDGRSDLMLYNASTGVWVIDPFGRIQRSPGDIPVPADYDGTGTAAVAVFRPSTGMWLGVPPYRSMIEWGGDGDVPVPADYDGDGKADIAVYRPSTGHWFILSSRSNFTTYTDFAWGAAGDVPVPADYDGDGTADVAVYRPGTGVWYVVTSSSGFRSGFARTWGLPGDVPIVGDFDGDGKSDFAVYRPTTGVWFILTSGSNYTTWIAEQWGAPGDIPVAGDYDGDGAADITIFRPSTGNWFILKSSSGYTTWDTYLWGNAGDRPVLGPQ
jgi:uncharacterized repeat protein (TIGR03803 family)